MIINHNVMAMNTHRQLGINNGQTAKSLEKLSSGCRINRAGDDAAGLAISEKMRGQIRGLGQAARNAQDGISLIQTAEGALNETHDILQRMRELAVQSGSDTNTANDRAEMQKEIDQLAAEVTRISTDTEFNTKQLLNGDMGKTYAVTANAWNPATLQITGSDITTGTYTMTMTAAGTDTTTVGTETAGGGAIVAGDFSYADGTAYGDYTLNVTAYDGVGKTADFELIGPNGNQLATSSGAATDADLTIGGVTVKLGTHNVTSNGTVAWSLTKNAVDIDLSGAKTVNSAAIAAYAGETVNLGGFEFTMTVTAADSNGDAWTANVTDKAIKLQIGANTDQNTSVDINEMGASALGIGALDLTQTGANSAITSIETAITTVSSERAKLGAIQNRLEHTGWNIPSKTWILPQKICRLLNPESET